MYYSRSNIIGIFDCSFSTLLTLRFIIIGFFSFFLFFNLTGQEKVEISKPIVQLENDKVLIDYGILGSSSEDLFKVWLEITDNNGANVIAKSVYGDIGDSISGGLTKRIIWDLVADNIYLDMGIYIEVVAERIAVLESLPPERKDMNVADIEEKNITTPKNKPDFNPESNTESSSVKVGTNLLLSTILPGWGLTRLSEGKPYWLIGIAGTGCIVSSVYFNSLAVSNYNDYLSSTDSGKRGSYFDTSKRNFTVSKVCAWSAVAIWAVDLGVLGLKASKMKKTASVNRLKSLSIESKFDYLSSTHQLSVCYKF